MSDPQAFYDQYGEAEWDRLAHGIDGRLEFEGSIKAIETTLPEDGHILDAGGGAGRYTVWLAEQGYEVTLLDLSRRQLELARERIDDAGVGERVTSVHGSITDIPAPEGRFDAVCCLGGPLSHLTELSDRQLAARELSRVAARKAPVFVSVIGRLGFLQLYLTTGLHLEVLPEVLETGDYTGDALAKHGYEHVFTDTHLFRRVELIDLLSEAGLEVDGVVGLEGLGSLYQDDGIRAGIEDVSDDERAAIWQTIAASSDDPVVADLSVHMLAIASA